MCVWKGGSFVYGKRRRSSNALARQKEQLYTIQHTHTHTVQYHTHNKTKHTILKNKSTEERERGQQYGNEINDKKKQERNKTDRDGCC